MKPGTSGTRCAVFDLLTEYSGWVSGELLSGRLGISRAAVAKHVSSLRREGHAIFAAPRRGYHLMARVEPLRPDTVKPLLRTRVLGRGAWLCLAETSSTSTQALAWAAEGAPEGSIVVADFQTHGRGRKGGVWHSTPRGLLCSIILRPDNRDEYGLENWNRSLESLIRLCVESVAATLTEYGAQGALVKEPNDVLLDGKKCCGVLVELGLAADGPDWAVVGIGCNLNALPDELPEDTGYGITSFMAATGFAVPVAHFFATLLERCEKSWQEAGLLRTVGRPLQEAASD